MEILCFHFSESVLDHPLIGRGFRFLQHGTIYLPELKAALLWKLHSRPPSSQPHLYFLDTWLNSQQQTSLRLLAGTSPIPDQLSAVSSALSNYHAKGKVIFLARFTFV